MEQHAQPVVIGMDPHKRSVTIEVMDAEEQVLGGGRFGTDVAGYRAMLEYVHRWPNRMWAIEGCSGIGRHVALRLLTDGQEVVDVPAKLSARARIFSTGQGHKTDATDAHSVALVGTRMAGLRSVVDDQQLVESTGHMDGQSFHVRLSRGQGPLWGRASNPDHGISPTAVRSHACATRSSPTSSARPARRSSQRGTGCCRRPDG